MSRTVRCRDLAGTLVLDLSSAGYELDMDGVNDGGRTWRRITTTSPFVDGVHEVSKVLDVNSVKVTLRLVSTTWVGVETLRQALLAAVEPSVWLLEIVVDGVSYTHRAYGADSVAGLLTSEVGAMYRTISLSIPVQPTPAITGI